MLRTLLIAAVCLCLTPAIAQDIPKLKRDSTGKIIAVPGEPVSDNLAPGSSGAAVAIPSAPPAAPLDRYDASGPPARRQTSDPFGAISARMELTRRMQEDKARQIQTDVDRVIREERGRRGVDMTARERALADNLRTRDREVQQHEMQHYQTGRPFTRPPEYWYVTGPDGRRYAVSGVTRIDISVIPGDPQATLDKFMTLKRAALAPHDPSEEDRRLALELDRAIMQYQAERNQRMVAPKR